MRLLAVWLINAVALLALPWLLPSIQVASFGTALLVAVVLFVSINLLVDVLYRLLDPRVRLEAAR